MKKYILASLALLSCYSASAQSSRQVLSGDFDGSNTITVADVTYMTDIILGKREPVFVTIPSVTTELLIRRQTFVDESGTFPQFQFIEGQYLNLVGIRAGQFNSVVIPVTSVEDDGLSAHSDGGLFSLRQDETQYELHSGSFEWIDFFDGVYHTYYDFGREQRFNYREKRLNEDCYFCQSQPVSFVDGVASFELHSLNALVRLSLSGLTPGTNINYIDLESDEALFMGHRYVCVTADGVQLSDRDSDNTNTLRLYTDECTVDNEGKCEVYMVMGAADLSGHEFRIKAFINNVPFTATTSGQRMEMNHCYTYAASGFAMQGNTVTVGANTVNGGEYIFQPADGGIYDITCDAGLEVYDAPMSAAGGYQMEAGTPYRINVYGDGNLNIEKKVFEAFEFSTAKLVTAGTYYQLTIPAAGFYHLTTANDNNVMWHERYGEFGFPGWPDYIYLESGTNIVRFQNDDNVTISPLASIAVGTANAVEAQTYYTFNIEEEGIYSITSAESNHISIFGDEINTDGDTPQYYYMHPNEREHRILVQDPGTLTITLEDAPSIELGTATQVYSNNYDNRNNNIYKFVVTEKALYQITTPEGYYTDMVIYGENKIQALDPGTYFIRFYSSNSEPEQITISIDKTEAEALRLNAVNTVQLSSSENPIYYHFQVGPDDWATYYLHPGVGCNFEVSNNGQSRFMSSGGNKEYYVYFWSNTSDPSVTTSTFSISKAEVADMPIGEPVEVSADKLYRIRFEEDGEYYFSAINGCHIANEWGGTMESQKHWMNSEGEMRIYFYSDTEDIATTTAQVKKVEYLALPYNEETTVALDDTFYTFDIQEDGNYAIVLGDGCSYYVEEFGSYIDYLNTGTYQIRFSNNGNASLTSTTFRISKLDDMAIDFSLGTEITVDAGMWYKLEITEDDMYGVSMDPSWFVRFKDMVDVFPGENVFLSADNPYYICFIKQNEEAPSSANVTIGKLADMAQAIDLGSTILPVENQWYKFEINEHDTYRITRNGDWTYEILYYGNLGETITLEPNSYLIRFRRGWWSEEEGNVTISQLSDVEIALGATITVNDREQWYKFSIPEPGAYKFTTTGDWDYEIYDRGFLDEIASLSAGNYYVHFYPANDDAASSTQVQITSFETEAIMLDESFTVNDPEQYFTIILSENDFYQINVSEGWSCSWGNEIFYQYAGVYTLRFDKFDDAYESANVTISKVAEHVALSLGDNATECGKLYTFSTDEPGFYAIHTTNVWNGPENVDYYTMVNDDQLFYFRGEGAKISYIGNGENMTITKLNDELPCYGEVKLGEEMHYDRDQLYKIVITEEGNYRMTSSEITGMWWGVIDIDYQWIAGLNDDASCWLTPGTYYTISSNDNNITIYKE